MRVTTIHGTRDIRLEDRPAPTVQLPTDAIVRTVAACVCGSDLWPYRGENDITVGNPIGHETIGVVEEVGSEVSSFKPGDFVVIPFCHCDNTCAVCRKGMQAGCLNLGMTQGGQGELVRATQADGSLVEIPLAPDEVDDRMVAALMTLADVLPTGWHAAVSARVEPGSSVVVVGDGAVGLCGVLAARELGAERIIAMSRHAPRQEIARAFGATDVVEERDKEGVARVLDLTDGIGADAVLECVGTDSSMKQALRSARPGAMVGYVGVPHGVNLPINAMFGRNVGVAGGMAPVRKYLPDLLERTLTGAVDASPVFDSVMGLDDVAEAYAAMDERRAVKVLLRP